MVSRGVKIRILVTFSTILTLLNGLKYDFSARDFDSSTLPSGWSNTRPTSVATSYSFAVIKIVETNFEGNSETTGNQTKTVLNNGIFCQP